MTGAMSNHRVKLLMKEGGAGDDPHDHHHTPCGAPGGRLAHHKLCYQNAMLAMPVPLIACTAVGYLGITAT